MATSTVFTVAEGPSIMDKSRKILTPGTVVKKAQLGKGEFDEHVASGRLVETLPQGVPVKKAPPKQGGKWNVDPDAIKAAPLAQLNMMIQEREPGHVAYEEGDIEVARLLLSQNFIQA